VARRSRKARGGARPAAAIVPAPAPARPTSPWLVSRGYDLAIYAASPLWAAALVLALGRVVEPVRIWFVFNIVLTAAHYGPTWLRAYGDREERARHRWSLFLFPPAVIAFAWWTRDRPEILAFLTFLWDRWHAVMQNYGFLRLYDAKAGTSAPGRGRSDFAVLWTVSLLLLTLNVGLLAPLLAGLATIGLSPITSVTAVTGLRIGCGVAAAISVVRWGIEARRIHAERRGPQLPRFAFLGCLVAGHVLMNSTTNIFLLSAQEKVYHSLQYVALSWHYSRSRAGKAPAEVTGGVFRGVFAPRRWPLYLGLVAAWTVAVYFANRAIGGGGTGPGLFTSVIGALALCHYYFDSFLWRVRRPEVRANL
jgi:hypothetical protein